MELNVSINRPVLNAGSKQAVVQVGLLLRSRVLGLQVFRQVFANRCCSPAERGGLAANLVQEWENVFAPRQKGTVFWILTLGGLKEVLNCYFLPFMFLFWFAALQLWDMCSTVVGLKFLTKEVGILLKLKNRKRMLVESKRSFTFIV